MMLLPRYIKRSMEENRSKKLRKKKRRRKSINLNEYLKIWKYILIFYG